MGGQNVTSQGIAHAPEGSPPSREVIHVVEEDRARQAEQAADDRGRDRSLMRTGGFPCRLLGCSRVFQVIDQKSMAALNTASGARTDHEVSAHGYHHIRPRDEPSYMAFQRSKPRPAAGK